MGRRSDAAPVIKKPAREVAAAAKKVDKSPREPVGLLVWCRGLTLVVGAYTRSRSRST